MKDNDLGSALTLISSLEPSDQDYNIAKNKLTEAFANPESEKFRTINLLTEMNINEGDPFEFVSKMTNIENSINDLKINTDFFTIFCMEWSQ